MMRSRLSRATRTPRGPSRGVVGRGYLWTSIHHERIMRGPVSGMPDTAEDRKQCPIPNQKTEKECRISLLRFFLTFGAAGSLEASAAIGNRARKSSKPAIHLALERLQPIDATLHRTVAPTFSERVLYRGPEGSEDFGPLRYRTVTPPIRTLNDPRACEASILHPFEEKGR
jgi:hypothetical protein